MYKRVECEFFVSEFRDGKRYDWFSTYCPFCYIENTYLVDDNGEVVMDESVVCSHFDVHEGGWTSFYKLVVSMPRALAICFEGYGA